MDIDSVGASIAGFLYRRSAEKLSRPATFVQMTLPYTKGNDLNHSHAMPYNSTDYLLSAAATSTAQATIQPTAGLLPIPSFYLQTVRQSAYGP